VIFKVTQNDGTVSSDGSSGAAVLTTTDAQGKARAQWTLGSRAGAGGNAVEAYAVGVAGTALFAASGTQGAPGKIVVDAGNDQIGVVGEPLPKPLIAVVVDGGSNRLKGVPVTFRVIEGGGSFAGSPTFTVNTDSDGRAAANLTLGLLEGEGNNVVEVAFPSSQGLPIAFKASGRVAGNPAETSISGVVLDNSNAPIPGVTVRAVLTTALRANLFVLHSVPAIRTDAQGQFVIPGAPVGFVKLMVDGTTAQAPGDYPSLEYDVVTVAGRVNTLGMPIYLLPLSTANKLCVDAASGGGTLEIKEAPGFSLTFGPGQVTFPGGSKKGCVSVTVVHGDKVPMVPGFGQQPRFIVTIQPAGATFSPPAPITLPNVDGLSPRAVTEMYSFDHDIGSFVAIGTGTVSDDGLTIRSNPGVGVLKAGWHCGGDPAANGTIADCPQCKWCQNNKCVADPAQVDRTCCIGGNPCGYCGNGTCNLISSDQDERNIDNWVDPACQPEVRTAAQKLIDRTCTDEPCLTQRWLMASVAQLIRGGQRVRCADCTANPGFVPPGDGCGTHDSQGIRICTDGTRDCASNLPFNEGGVNYECLILHEFLHNVLGGSEDLVCACHQHGLLSFPCYTLPCFQGICEGELPSCPATPPGGSHPGCGIGR